ncbi:ribonuclease III [uncultured Cetobacterium sp.]|uniref:ribonuclease III n=1 Tax=uncultured Cetobacterium sp. TaxID=527638 RepID=UPI00262E6164|nr:ribonuclease III [uncultured Cetobacterium sp.]
MRRSFLELEKKIGYTFKNKDLLKNALIHRSFGNEHTKYKKINNERLELLGDAVLDLIVTEHLYKSYPNALEGDLAKLKAMVVSEPVLAKISRALEFGEYLMLSKGEELTGGRGRNSILGDVFEAILGAVYLDSDFIAVKEIAMVHLRYSIEHINENEEILDFKTILQEYSQKEYKIIPIYEVVNEDGPDHLKIFEVSVKIKDELLGIGKGKNKKSAEQAAAKDICKRLGVKLYETL